MSFEVDYVERRSRLTAFFRAILVIPLAIVLYFYGLLATIAIVIAWFAIVISGRYPRGLYEFVAGFNRALARIMAYALLLADPYPPFGGRDDPSYPVRMSFARPLERYSRLKTFSASSWRSPSWCCATRSTCCSRSAPSRRGL